MSTGGGQVCVLPTNCQCFTRHVPDQELRYQAVSRQLAAPAPSSLSQQWKMGFEYLPDAIRVGVGRYPVLKMEWVQGVTLSAWLDMHHRDTSAVALLADRFRLRQTNNNGYRNVTAVIVRSNGYEVHVKGIGESKVQTLEDWRLEQLRYAQAQSAVRVPVLSSSRRQTVESEFRLRGTQLADQRRAAESQAVRQRSQPEQRLQDARSRLDIEDSVASAEAQRQREDFARREIRIQTSRTDLTNITNALAQARRLRRTLSHTRYLRFALTGR